jgi:hypothetical protein
MIPSLIEIELWIAVATTTAFVVAFAAVLIVEAVKALTAPQPSSCHGRACKRWSGGCMGRVGDTCAWHGGEK